MKCPLSVPRVEKLVPIGANFPKIDWDAGTVRFTVVFGLVNTGRTGRLFASSRNWNLIRSLTIQNLVSVHCGQITQSPGCVEAPSVPGVNGAG